jgi:thiol-disulfide isomerase/thioredoxin
MAMAKNENKVIFLDAYTSWCGPCKWMAANMFTKDSIADFYNQKFICAHFDMEKGEGITLARTYQVKAYPTLLFINNSGEMVHVRVGAPQKVSDYLEMGNFALTPGEGFSDYQKQFQSGNRNPDFILKYLTRLQNAYIPVDETLKEYFSTIKDQDLVSRDNWNISYQFVNDMNSREFVYLQKHQIEFEKLYTKDSVNQKIFNVYIQSLTALTHSRTFNDESYKTLKQQIRDSGYGGADKVIFVSDLTLYQSRSDIGNYLSLVYDHLDTFYGNDYDILHQVSKNVLQISNDKKYLEKAAGWTKKSISINSTHENNDTYANLSFKLGDKASAIKYENMAIELAKKEKVAIKEYEDNLKKFQETANP